MTTEKESKDSIYDMFDFIERSPSCYHVIENAEKRLRDNGYVQICEQESWELVHGGKYYVNRNNSSMIAFHIPENQFKGFHMIASHSDSPGFKIKENPELAVENQYIKLNIEKYGGMIMSSWMDRPLSVAGRVVIAPDRSKPNPGGRMVSKTVAIDKDLLLIPNMAVHMKPDMNKGMEYSVQTDMLPLFGGINSKGSFQKIIAETAGVDEKDIMGSDLFLYNREKGRVFGAEEEYICSPRLDDMECVYASLEAMIQGKPKEYINLAVIFDNEEVGSVTRQGAASTFLQDTLNRICESFSLSRGDYGKLLADSFMISADNAHGVHPNHPEKADPTNRPYLNRGIVIKYHGSQKYTTDAISAAEMKEICNCAQVPFQTYANHSDIAGGSTLGNISAAQVPVSTVDIGLPQLAMHSAYETAGSKDLDWMIRAMEYFYNL